MKRVNKVLVLFLFVLTLLFMLTWELLQSRWVANYVSNVATKYVAEVLDAEIKFENLEFTLFPPGADVKNISFKAKKEKLEINLLANKLGIYFNPFDVFETDFIVDRIYIEDGNISVAEQDEEAPEKVKKTGGASINLDFFDTILAVPVNRFELEKISIEYNKFNVFSRDMMIQNKKKHLELVGTAERIALNFLLNQSQYLDSVYLDLKLDKRQLEIRELLIKSGFLELEAQGDLEAYVSKNIRYSLDYHLNGPLNTIHDFVDLSRVGRFESGALSVKGKISGVADNFNVTADIEAQDVITDFADADKIELKALVNKEQIKINSFQLLDGRSQLQLKKPFELFNLTSKKFVEEPIFVEAKQLSLSNSLKYLGSSLDILQGEISGKLRFDLFERSFSFKFQDEAKIDYLELKLSDEINAFELKDFDIQDGVINVVEGKLDLSISLKSLETQLTVLAETKNDKFYLTIPNSFVNLEKISPVLGYQMGGEGMVNISIDDGVLDLGADLNRFDINNYSLDKVKGEVAIDLNKENIDIKSLFASSGKSSFLSQGKIDLKERKVDARYKIQNASFSEVKRVLRPLMQTVQISTNEIHGNWSLEGKVSGGIDIENLQVLGRLKGKNNYFFDESFEDLDFAYALKDEVIEVNDFRARKSGGVIGLNFSYSLKNSMLKFDSSFNQILLQELTWYKRVPLTLRGELKGSISGSYFENKWEVDSNIRLKDTYSLGEAYPDSVFKLAFNDDNIKTKLDLFDSQIELNSEVFLKEELAANSFLNLDLNIPNIRNLFGLISVVDLSSSDLSGRVRYSLRSKFNPLKRKFSDIETNMMNFVLNKKPISIRYKDSEPEIIVVDGVIKKWDVDIKGNKIYFISKGEGNIFEDFQVVTQSKIDASIIEIFNTVISKANGNIRANVNYGHKDDKEDYQAYLTSNNLSVLSEFLPTAVTKADFKISLKDKVFDVESFYAQLVTGTLELDGRVSLKSIVPDINIRYKFKDAGITIMNKSNLVFSGEGSFVGKNFPYTLGGDYYVEKFVLVNEVTDFVGAGKSFSPDEIEFLPGSKKQAQEQLVNFNINVSTRNPIFVRNSLADLGFNGTVQVTGNEEQPQVRGEVTLAARNNKINFKNNEFNLSKGRVFFSEQNEYTNPELDFSANTNINEYNVYINVVGPVKNFKVDLNSEPALAQSDILSLIAFGYTEDLSNNLSDEERESMTRAGVGSILFDSFKINETLKKEFGLQVNLGTQISQEEGSLLTGRNSEGNGNAGRVRSATTLEIKKNLNDALSLSVSSTVDTSTEQKQSINLNYNINNNISVEGVYESRNTDDVETINLDSSVGADVKWKWSFK